MARALAMLLAAIGIGRSEHRDITPLWYLAGAFAFLAGLFEIVKRSPGEILFLGAAAITATAVDTSSSSTDNTSLYVIVGVAVVIGIILAIPKIRGKVVPAVTSDPQALVDDLCRYVLAGLDAIALAHASAKKPETRMTGGSSPAVAATRAVPRRLRERDGPTS